MPKHIESMTKTGDKLTDPSIRKLLEGKNFVFVSTLMRDGMPHITPTWVNLEEDDGHLLVNTAIGRVKQKTYPEILTSHWPLRTKIILMTWFL